jgi:hypothetical protein
MIQFILQAVDVLLEVGGGAELLGCQSRDVHTADATSSVTADRHADEKRFLGIEEWIERGAWRGRAEGGSGLGLTKNPIWWYCPTRSSIIYECQLTLSPESR